MSDSQHSLASGKSPSFLERRLSLLSVSRRGSESTEEVRGPLGLTLLHNPFEPLIDFVFVHGLRGGSRKTWSKSDDLKHFWPQQWLPSEPGFKNVRIHSFGYNSDWGQRKASALNIHDFGQALLADLYNSPHISRSGAETPIVLIGHSMGGIVIKKAFLLATQDSNYRTLGARIHSMFFLATPHRGADNAQLLNNIIRLTATVSSKAYVGDLVPNSGALQIINDEFRNLYGETQLWSFYETVPIGMGVVVEKDSAAIGLPGERVQYLDADHRNVCKFDAPTDNNYCILRNAFVSTICSIEKFGGSERKEEHRVQMRTLSQYLGVTEKPEVDLTNVLENKVEGSCEWLTNSTAFLQWMAPMQDTPKHFWLSGGPASGKSTIAGYVARYLEEYCGDSMYFFLKDGDPIKSTISEMLRSLAWQMACANTDVRQTLLEMEHDGEPIDKTDARALWRTVFATRICHVELRQPCYWVIDALDECTNHSTLFPFLAKIDRNFPLRVFMTSRPLPSIERLFSQERLPKLHQTITWESSRGDIQLFLKANARYLPVDEDSEREDLTQQILEKSNGNFLWVSLVLKELLDVHSKQQILDVLKSVPGEIDGLYSRILRNISSDPRSKHLAKAVLKWTVCAARPLTVDELREALNLDLGETLHRLEATAGTLCGHLIYVDGKQRVQVAHQTVRAFLLRSKRTSEFEFNQQEEHTRLSETCLKYLNGEEMKPNRYRRGSRSARSVERSTFAQYSMVHFSDHLARSNSSNDIQLSALNTFLQTNSLTWVELVAKNGDLSPLTQTANNLKTYLERRAKYNPPLGLEIQNISAWSRDLIQLVGRFGQMLLTSPHAIHFIVPPVCPTESIIARTFKDYPRALRMAGLSQKDWDDQLCCIAMANTQVLSIACRDNKFALGTADGMIYIYNATTFQQEIKLSHKERVRSLEFGYTNTTLAAAGKVKIHIWNTATGTVIQTFDSHEQILALDFGVDNSQLVVATRANLLQFWRIADAVQVEAYRFSDVDEDDGRPIDVHAPTHAAFSAELNLLAVAYRQRPVSLWDLKEGEFVGQLHNFVAKFGPLIFALIFNLNPGLALAAVAYDDGKLITFDVWTQEQKRSVEAEAATLASSPDGTILATGDGVGTITLYEFETLKMLYRVNSFEQSIRSLAFNSNNTRFFDIRGNYCNVWEPPLLIHHTDVEETSSVDLSEAVSFGPQFGKTQTYDDDRAITAICIHHTGDALFCGREDGSIGLYSTEDGSVIKELRGHAKYLAVLYLDWNESGSLLASIDRSGRFMVKRVAFAKPGEEEYGSPILDKKCSGSVNQIKLSPGGDRLLLSKPEEDQLWNVHEGTLICSQIDPARETRTWVSHPSAADKLLLFRGATLEIFDWNGLSKSSPNRRVELGFDTTYSKFFASTSSQTLCIAFPGSRTNQLAAMLHLLPTRAVNLQIKALEYNSLAKIVRAIVGYHKSTLVFLTYDGWICSIVIDDSNRKRNDYTKHFFIPSNFHGTAEALIMGVTVHGSIILVHKDAVLIFHGGFAFEDQVEIDTATTSSRAPTRLSLRRTIQGSARGSVGSSI